MAHIIHVGNSFGVRIPKAILEQVGFKEDTNLLFKVTGEGLLITPAKIAREGWEEKFKPIKKSSKERTLMGDFANEFDVDEWKW